MKLSLLSADSPVPSAAIRKKTFQQSTSYPKSNFFISFILLSKMHRVFLHKQLYLSLKTQEKTSIWRHGNKWEDNIKTYN
jgi:hypothetical protein